MKSGNFLISGMNCPNRNTMIAKTFFIAKAFWPYGSKSLRDHGLLPASYPRGVCGAWRSRPRATVPGMAEPLTNIVEAGWAEALAPVEDRIAQMGAVPARADRRRQALPARGRPGAARFQAAVRRRAGADRRPGPVSHARPPGRPQLLGRPRRQAAAWLARQHLPRVRRRPRLPAPSNGDLTPWTERGVLLLNRVLTVEPKKPGSHRGKGWEEVTEQAIRALARRDTPLVAILWGRDARNLAPLLGSIPRIESAHPSPMSAHGGFFGTRPFSRANQLLAPGRRPDRLEAPVNCRLRDPPGSGAR